jgi:hypothetical protein
MFVLPALILPLIFGLAITRLYQIPRKLWLGELQLAGKQHIYLSTITVTAYLALFGYTALLGTSLIQAVFFAENRLSAYLSVAVYAGAYPLIYIAAAWVFYYGLKPNSKFPN